MPYKEVKAGEDLLFPSLLILGVDLGLFEI
jgi:hypothetical protein